LQGQLPLPTLSGMNQLCVLLDFVPWKPSSPITVSVTVSAGGLGKQTQLQAAAAPAPARLCMQGEQMQVVQSCGLCSN